MVAKSQNYKTFGEFFRAKRVSLGFTLRAFCGRYGYDPGNVSRLERDILPPSINEEKLAGYATALKIKKETEEWVIFFDLAHLSRGSIPLDLKGDQIASGLLPAFFRTMRNKKIGKKKLKELIDLLEK